MVRKRSSPSNKGPATTPNVATAVSPAVPATPRAETGRRREAGLLASGSIALRSPSQGRVPQWHLNVRSPVTVAGAAAELLRVPKTKRVDLSLGRNCSGRQSRHGIAAATVMLRSMSCDSKYLAPVCALVVLWLATISASAFSDALGYVSIRRDQAYLREGPSYAHRILWVYRRRNYPLQLIGSYDAWRHVRDSDGTTGWMHHTQLSERRSVLFIGDTKSPMRQDDNPHGKVIAHAAPGVVALLKSCEPSVCEVDAAGIDGWVDKQDIWGVGAGEVFP